VSKLKAARLSRSLDRRAFRARLRRRFNAASVVFNFVRGGRDVGPVVACCVDAAATVDLARDGDDDACAAALGFDFVVTGGDVGIVVKDEI